MAPYSVLLCVLFVGSSIGSRISTRCRLNPRLCFFPNQAATPAPTSAPTNEYYFGTQSLLCVLTEKPAMTGSYSRFPFAPWHRLLKYRNYVLEWGTSGFSINFNRSISDQCPITWEDQPAGTSSKTMEQVNDFGRMYQNYNGEYNMFWNNCHMFANDLERFLTHERRPVRCPSQHQAAMVEVPTCPAGKTEAFKATYPHYLGLAPTTQWTVVKCRAYKQSLIRFMRGYCDSMETRLITTVQPPPAQTTLSVMGLARRMARERAEMLRRGQ